MSGKGIAWNWHLCLYSRAKRAQDGFCTEITLTANRQTLPNTLNKLSTERNHILPLCHRSKAESDTERQATFCQGRAEPPSDNHGHQQFHNWTWTFLYCQCANLRFKTSPSLLLKVRMLFLARAGRRHCLPMARHQRCQR